MIRLILLALVLEMLCSCDPGYSVILSNKSQTARRIKVIDVNANKVLSTDSISVADTSDQEFFTGATPKEFVNVEKTSSDSYAFILEKGKEALLQNGIGGPNLNEKIIVEESDTIWLNKDKRSVIKRKFMYTSVRVTIR